MRNTGLLLVLVVALAGSTVAQDLSKLVPADSMAVIYAPSFKSLEAKAGELGKALGQEAQIAGALGMAKMMMLGPAGELFDNDKPLAVAIAAPEGGLMGGEPVPTIIVPITDAEKAKEMGLESHGGYLLLSESGIGKPPAKASRLMTGMPSGDLVMRVDMAQVWKLTKPMIEGGMAEPFLGLFFQGFAEGLSNGGMEVDPDEMIEKAMEAFTGFMADSDILDLRLNTKGSMIALDTHLSLKAGSKNLPKVNLQSGLAAMARLLPANQPMVILGSIDLGMMKDLNKMVLGNLVENAPEEKKATAKKAAELSQKTYELMGNDFAATVAFGQQGMIINGLFSTKDAEQLVKLSLDNYKVMKDLEAEQLPQFKVLEPVTVEGIKVHKATMNFDPETFATGVDPEQFKAVMGKLCGPEGLKINMAPASGKLVVGIGSTDASTAALAKAVQTGKGGGTSPALASTLKKAGPAPYLVGSIDISHFMKFFGNMAMAMGEEVPNLGNLKPTFVSGYFGPDASGYRLGFELDAKGIMEIGKIMDK